MPITPRPPQWKRTSAMQRLPRPDVTLRIRVNPGTISSLYTAVSRDVSVSAPQAPRIEPRPVNETDFTHEGVAEPGTEFPVHLWHRGVTN